MLDFNHIPLCGLASDAAHSRKHKRTEFRVVDIATGKELIYKDLGNATTNIGEYLGIVEAVKYVLFEIGEKTTIYSDSFTAIAWFNDKYTASQRSNKDLLKGEMFLLATQEIIKDLVEVKYWDNKLWGETPADFGNK